MGKVEVRCASSDKNIKYITGCPNKFLDGNFLNFLTFKVCHFCEKFRQIEGTSVLLCQNVNKLSRIIRHFCQIHIQDLLGHPVEYKVCLKI